MTRQAELGFEDSIANALGMLYERKARGTTLIRVLEDYRRFKAAGGPTDSDGSVAGRQQTVAPQRELERLYMRRAAVDQVIRSIEAYSRPHITPQAHR